MQAVIINLLLFQNILLNTIQTCVNAESVQDYEFDQIISFQSVYEAYATSPNKSVLPFVERVQSALYDANGRCFVALTADNIMWSARKTVTSAVSAAEDFTKSPYSEWKKVYDFGAADFSEIRAMTKAPDSIVLATSSQLIEVVMDFTCTSLISLDVRVDNSVTDLSSLNAEENEASIVTSSSHFLSLPWGSVASFVSDGKSRLWMGTDKGLFYVETADASAWYMHRVADIPVQSTVVSLLWVEQWQTLYVSTCDVLYDLRFSTGTTTIGSHRKQQQHQQQQQQQQKGYIVHTEWIEGNIDSTVVSMAYDTEADCIWVVEKDAVHRKNADGTWWRSGFYQGAPTDNITTVAVEGAASFGGYIWLGTADKGIVRMRKGVTDDDTSVDNFPASIDLTRTDPLTDEWLQWQVYYGARYIPDGEVVILVSDSNTGSGGDNSQFDTNTLVVTSSGLTIMSTQQFWTLEQKASAMQTFQYPRHDRNGIVAEVSLSTAGDVSTYSHAAEDSDSIWTSQYAVAAAMRYSITKSEADRISAWRTFEALELLGNITGVPGLVGRSMCSPQERASTMDGAPHPTAGCGVPGEGNWYESTIMPGWVWKGDTSSDTVDGHYFAYGVVLDTVAITDEEKARVVGAIDRISSYIVENDLYYIDVTGEPTLWGRWNPVDLNENPQYVSERGGNSLEILAFLAMAYSVTGKEMYVSKFKELVQEYGYYENTLNQKIDNPYDDNHSDNELGFLAYHTLFYAHQRLLRQDPAVRNETLLHALEDMVTPVIPSIKRWYSVVKNERQPLWVAGVAGAAGVSLPLRDVDKAAWSLRLYSLDLINWNVKNSWRWDCVLQPYGDRGDASQLLMSKIRPPSERIMGHYNTNPFKMDTDPSSISAYDNGGGGGTEYSPAEWLLPYWMLRFYDLLE